MHLRMSGTLLGSDPAVSSSARWALLHESSPLGPTRRETIIHFAVLAGVALTLIATMGIYAVRRRRRAGVHRLLQPSLAGTFDTLFGHWYGRFL